MHEGIIALLCTAILITLTPSAVAEPTPLNLNDFAYGAELAPAETEFRRVTLTPTMINDIQRRDLGDVRVFDEDNELMPIMVRKKGRGIKTSRQPLTFKTHVIEGRTVSYILDRTANHNQWLKSLYLRWEQGAAPKILAMRVEHSADKNNWEMLRDSEMVNNYEFNGITLKQNVVDIRNYTQRYIKLTLLDTKYSPSLTSVSAYTTNKELSDDTWLLAGQLQPQADQPNSYRFSVSEGVSPQLLRLSFNKLNTLLSGSLYTFTRVNGQLQRKLAIKNLRAYKVTLNNKVVKSKPIDVSEWQSSEWLITADAASNLQADDLPDVMAAYPEYEVIFANDGGEPYTLVWGNRAAGKPEASDIVKRIKASKQSLQDITVVTPGRILNTAELTEIMESRYWTRLLLLIGMALAIIAVVAAIVGYMRYKQKGLGVN